MKTRVWLFFMMVLVAVASARPLYAVDMVVVSSVAYDSGSDDTAAAVAIDEQGYIFVAGTSNNKLLTMKYNKTLSLISSRIDDNGGVTNQAFGLAIDRYANVIVTGQTNAGDFITIKYDQNLATIISSAVYDGGNTDLATGVCTDSVDNIIVAGYSSDGASYNYTVIKYDKNLATIRSRSYDSGGDDRANAVAVDSQNSIIVTGKSGGKYYTVKYDTELNVLSSARIDAGTNDEAKAVAVDSADNIIVTGSRDNGTTKNYYTVKYDRNLTKLASVEYDSGSNDVATGVTVDPNDNVIVTGYIFSGSAKNYYTIKYDKNLSLLSKAAYDSGNLDQAAAVASDADGGMVVTGTSNGGATLNYFTIQYAGSPMISSATIMYQGETQDIDILGKNLMLGATVTFTDPGISAGAVFVSPPTRMAVTARIANTVPLGVTSMTVVNPNGEAVTKGDVVVLCRHGISPTTSSEITSLLPAGRMTLGIAANTFLTVTTVTIASLTSFPAPANGLKASGVGVRIDNTSAAAPQEDVTLVLPYTARDIIGINATRLAIAFYDTQTRTWIFIKSVADTAGQTVSCSTRHFNGIFAILELPPLISALGTVRVYPNPYRPGSASDFDDSTEGKGIVFSNLTQDVKLKIFTIAGNLVYDKAVTADVNGNFVWDTVSTQGDVVASGLYLYVVVDSNDAAQKAKGKFAIIR